METGCQSQHTDNPPQYPRKYSHAVTPDWHTYQDDHVNKCGKTYRKGCQEQALMRMPKYSWKNLGIETVPEARNSGKEKEQD